MAGDNGCLVASGGALQGFGVAMPGDFSFYLSWAAFAVYAGLLAAAALFDLMKFIIPNLVSGALVLLFFPFALLLPAEVDWLSHLGAAAACFAVTIGLYSFGWFGAGDVKLLTGASLWAGFALMPALLVYMSLAGGALTLTLLVTRHLVAALAPASSTGGELEVPKLFKKGAKIPYGVAISCGALLIGFDLPFLWASP